MDQETPYDPAWELYQKTRSAELKKSESLRQEMMNAIPLRDEVLDRKPTLTERLEAMEKRMLALEDNVYGLTNNLEHLRRLI